MVAFSLNIEFSHHKKSVIFVDVGHVISKCTSGAKNQVVITTTCQFLFLGLKPFGVLSKFHWACIFFKKIHQNQETSHLPVNM